MINIGIISPAEIAYRRFLPSLKSVDGANFIGVAIHSVSELTGEIANIEERLKNSYGKAEKIASDFGGKIYDSYEDLVMDADADAVYIPLPPILHFKYAKMALEHNKHVLVEKPATVSFAETSKLCDIATDRKLALHENFAFIYHTQIEQIKSIIKNGDIGKIRQYRFAFGFPFRGENDFRYIKSLGGGAINDNGGYPIKLAHYFLGDTSRIICASYNKYENDIIDIFGQGTIINDDGITAQFSFGMDNEYRCDIEVWGSKGMIKCDRIFSAPDGYVPKVILRSNNTDRIIELHSDNSFKKSIEYFLDLINNEKLRNKHFRELEVQSKLFSDFKAKAGINW